MPKTDLSFRPMTVGAEVIGLIPGSESDPEIRAQLYQAWLDHGILLFNQVDTAEKHLALSRCFGDLEIHPFPESRSPENPLFIEIGGCKTTPPHVYDGKDIRVNRIPWHRDTAYTPDLCKGAMLRMLDVPEVEGETLFADTAAAYDDLPPDMQARLARLEYKATLRLGSINQTRPGALWKTVRPATKEEDPGAGSFEVADSLAARYPSVVHPVVLTHPESGRKNIFLSPTYIDCFLGMSQAESDRLLEELLAHMLQPRYLYAHRWTVNQAIVWDNRRVMHASPGNLPTEKRRGLRTTLAGAQAVGRFYDDKATMAELPKIAD